MSRWPRISGKKFTTLLKSEGYELVRVKGSHHHFRHPSTGRIVTIPVHGNRTIPIGTLHYAVTEMMGISLEEFLKLLKK